MTASRRGDLPEPRTDTEFDKPSFPQEPLFEVYVSRSIGGVFPGRGKQSPTEAAMLLVARELEVAARNCVMDFHYKAPSGVDVKITATLSD